MAHVKCDFSTTHEGSLWPVWDIKSCITFQCTTKKILHTKLPHQQTIVQQTCASFMLPWFQETKSTTTTKTPVSLLQVKHILQVITEIEVQSARIKSKVLGFFANLGWTNLSVDKTNIEPNCGGKYLQQPQMLAEAWQSLTTIFYRFVKQLIGPMISLDDWMLKHYIDI